MRRKVVWTGQFKKDYKLANDEQLDEKNKDHGLSGNWEGHRECHILPDWLLIISNRR